LKFDERDILTDTHEVEYGFVTRLYAKRNTNKPEDCDINMKALMVGGPAPESIIPWQHPTTRMLANAPCQSGPQVREVVTWELDQKYFLDPTFGGRAGFRPAQRIHDDRRSHRDRISQPAAASFSAGFTIAG
jgi:LPS-assembly protein